MECDALWTDVRKLDCASFHRRDRRDEFRAASGDVRNTDVAAVLQPAALSKLSPESRGRIFPCFLLLLELDLDVDVRR